MRVIKFKESDLDRLVFPFKKHSILSLEYKPFSRFSLAKSLDEVFENKLSITLNEILNNRKTGTVIIEPEIHNKKFDKEFLVKLSTYCYTQLSVMESVLVTTEVELFQGSLEQN